MFNMEKTPEAATDLTFIASGPPDTKYTKKSGFCLTGFQISGYHYDMIIIRRKS